MGLSPKEIRELAEIEAYKWARLRDTAVVPAIESGIRTALALDEKRRQPDPTPVAEGYYASADCNGCQATFKYKRGLSKMIPFCPLCGKPDDVRQVPPQTPDVSAQAKPAVEGCEICGKPTPFPGAVFCSTECWQVYVAKKSKDVAAQVSAGMEVMGFQHLGENGVPDAKQATALHEYDAMQAEPPDLQEMRRVVTAEDVGKFCVNVSDARDLQRQLKAALDWMQEDAKLNPTSSNLYQPEFVRRCERDAILKGETK